MLYIWLGKARVERREQEIRTAKTLPDEERHARFDELDEKRHQFYEWELEVEDKALMRRAAKIGVYMDELDVNILTDVVDTIGRYHVIGTFGDTLLRDEYRDALRRAVREREPLYRKERREEIELVVKLITALTGIIGAGIGLLAILHR